MRVQLWKKKPQHPAVSLITSFLLLAAVLVIAKEVGETLRHALDVWSEEEQQ